MSLWVLRWQVLPLNTGDSVRLVERQGIDRLLMLASWHASFGLGLLVLLVAAMEPLAAVQGRPMRT